MTKRDKLRAPCRLVSARLRGRRKAGSDCSDNRRAELASMRQGKHLRSQFVEWRLCTARDETSIVVFTTYRDLADVVQIKHRDRPTTESLFGCFHVAATEVDARESALSCYLYNDATS